MQRLSVLILMLGAYSRDTVKPLLWPACAQVRLLVSGHCPLMRWRPTFNGRRSDILLFKRYAPLLSQSCSPPAQELFPPLPVLSDGMQTLLEPLPEDSTADRAKVPSQPIMPQLRTPRFFLDLFAGARHPTTAMRELLRAHTTKVRLRLRTPLERGSIGGFRQSRRSVRASPMSPMLRCAHFWRQFEAKVR